MNNENEFHIFYGHYEIVRCGSSSTTYWYPTDSVKITAENQYEANKKNFPNFALVRHNHSISGCAHA
tara:strand:- start:2540 stop:2740 length:201 start_codon:yes stop_codon:yes gene_type:complete